MQFDNTYTLARATPMMALTVAWDTCEASALRCARQERDMTIREAGALAELHGMKLLDVLSI